jgi:TrmH family RNA methyltransferase
MAMVTSARNPLLKEVRRAVQQGTLTGDGLCVAEGFHLLEEALRSDCAIDYVIVAEPVRAALSAHVAGLKHVRVVAIDEALFATISSTEASQGVVTLLRPPAWTLDHVFRGLSLVVIVDGVQDPGNGGAIVRAAEAFGATGVVFLKGSANPYNPKALRASAGSVFRIPLVAAADDRLLLAVAEKKRARLYAAMPRGGYTVDATNLLGRCAVVIGAEGRGVSQVLAKEATPLRIPTSAVESLNAAMAAGIILYEARRQRSTAIEAHA